MKHLLKLLDLQPAEITEILNLADQLKYEQKHKIAHPHLVGKSLGMIFEKPSTRTRVSFEVGVSQLGARALFLSARDLQMDCGEPIEDTARTLSRYVDGLLIRTDSQQDAEDLAQFGEIPVVNGLTDFAHPCQALATLMTLREYKGALEGLKLCFVGAGNAVCNSLIVGALKMGMRVAVATPVGHEPHADVLAFAAGKENFERFALGHEAAEAARGADVLYTAGWTPGMGEDVFLPFQVNEALVRLCNKDVMVQHCLPVHRGEEIDSSVFEAHSDSIFAEVENRLHVQKASLLKLLL